MNRRPLLSIFAPDASPEEAAAVVCALEQFMRATAPPPVRSEPRLTAWGAEALREGVARRPDASLPWP